MKRAILFFALVSPLIASAQRVTVQNGRPYATFTPVSGGYLLRQPGMQPNLSSIPREINPSAGIPGRPAFAGGRQYRMDGTGNFEMGGKYDMPMPKTAKTVPVEVFSNIPRKPMAKALLKTIPLVGNAMALAEILDLMRQEWDKQEPGTSSIVDYETGEIYRNQSDLQFYGSGAPGYYATANAACSAVAATAGKYWCGPRPMDQVGVFPAVTGNCRAYVCDDPDKSLQLIGTYGSTESSVKRPMPDSVPDAVADKLSDSQVESVLDHVQDSPKFTVEVPADSPTRVTGPATAPVSTTTTTSPNGTVTTNTTTQNISYQDNRVSIVTTTTTTVAAPDKPPETTVTEEKDENPTEPTEPKPPAESSLLCDLFPDILACKKLDEPPQEEIPKKTEDITLQSGPDFTGGACPPDVVVSVGGQQITVLATAVPCAWIESFIRPIILLLASISAVFIVLPRAD